MRWLALDVACAECAGGWGELIGSEPRVYDSLDAAKAGEAQRMEGPEWRDRKSGGAYSHDSAGGVEIIPLADPDPDPDPEAEALVESIRAKRATLHKRGF